MPSKHQGTVDELYDKYARTLEMLNEALDENQKLKEQLDEKPTEVVVEKEVEKMVEQGKAYRFRQLENHSYQQCN